MKLNLLNKDFFKKNAVSLVDNVNEDNLYSDETLNDDFILDTNQSSVPDVREAGLLTGISNHRLNELNIILNDNDCSDNFFCEICDLLSNTGLEITRSHKCSDINQDGSVVITLDQQYNSGIKTLVFAPYDNSRVGNSDALALSMHSALLENNVLLDDIVTGKIGFREEEDGSVSEVVPTDTETSIDLNADVSFVTVSFGTEDIDPNVITKCIESALARFSNYLDYFDSDTDLIYRAESGDSVEMIANYFHSNLHELREFNNLSNNSHLSNSQTIVNPNVSNITSFSKDEVFNLQSTDVKTI